MSPIPTRIATNTICNIFRLFEAEETILLGTISINGFKGPLFLTFSALSVFDSRFFL